MLVSVEAIPRSAFCLQSWPVRLADVNRRFRRVCVTTECSGKGPVTEPTAADELWLWAVPLCSFSDSAQTCESHSFYNLVGARESGLWYSDAKCLRSFQINDQLKF